MKQSKLQEKLNSLFVSADHLAKPHPELRQMAAAIEQSRVQMQGTMRVAFIGGVNKGKSTLMNAFLGEKLAETGNKELTCNVSWFRYGERPELRVHMLDGKIEQAHSLAELTTRCSLKDDYLDRIHYIEALQPSELLRHFDLIDTPGLYSGKPKNSEITRRFLAAPETKPHAVVFLFAQTLLENDVKELEAFQSIDAGAMTGINAIGALTKAESLAKGFESARQIIAQITNNHPFVRRRFYTIVPVAGQSAFGAQTVTADEESALRNLASLHEAQLQDMLEDAEEFTTKAYPPPVPDRELRAALFDRLGMWGIGQVAQLMRLEKSMPDICEHLMQKSNMRELQDLVTSHFGNRATLIQAAAALQAIREAAFYDGERLTGAAQQAAHKIVQEVDRMKMEEPRFLEFGVLESYYRGDFDLSESDLKQLLEVTGERGNSCAERLGAQKPSTLDGFLAASDDLMQTARTREAYWRARASDWISPDLRIAYGILAESNAEIQGRLIRATQLANEVKELINWEF